MALPRPFRDLGALLPTPTVSPEWDILRRSAQMPTPARRPEWEATTREDAQIGAPSVLPSLDELLANAKDRTTALTEPAMPTNPMDPFGGLMPFAGIGGYGTAMSPAFAGGSAVGPSLPTLPGLGAGNIGGGYTPGLGGTMGASPGGGVPGATDYTGGGTASGGYRQPGPLMNGDPGSAQQYGLDEKALRTVRGATLVKPAIQDLLKIERLTGTNVFEGVGGTFRTYEQQVAMDPDGDGYGSSGQLVAPPGHSMHEVGRAIDFDTQWLYEHPEVRRHLAEMGWVNSVDGEPWHWEYQGPISSGGKRQRSSGGGSTSSGAGGGGASSSPSRSSSPRRRRASPSTRESSSRRSRLVREGL
jgi:hypothetical protein